VSKPKDDPMTLNREHFLITLCMLLMISLFTPQSRKASNSGSLR